MELIDRYVYAVTRRLPEKKRSDIEKELRSIIDDMLEQNQGPEQKEAKVKKVLLELGDPDILADNYQEKKRYLIGPELFNKYLLVLKIVLIAVFVGVSIATLISSIFSQDPNIDVNFVIVIVIRTYIGSVFAAMLQAFAWVTISFAIAEHYGVNLSDASRKESDWSVADLPQIPQQQAYIPRSESIAAIIFSTLFIILFWSAVDLIGAGYYTEQTGWVIVPAFNLDVISSFSWLIIGSFLVSIVKEVLKLIVGKWSLRLSILVTGLSLISLVLTIFVLSNPGIWNPNFVAELSGHMELDFDIYRLWNIVTRNLVFVMVLAFLIESATALYKGIKYSNI